MPVKKKKTGKNMQATFRDTKHQQNSTCVITDKIFLKVTFIPYTKYKYHERKPH